MAGCSAACADTQETSSAAHTVRHSSSEHDESRTCAVCVGSQLQEAREPRQEERQEGCSFQVAQVQQQAQRSHVKLPWGLNHQRMLQNACNSASLCQKQCQPNCEGSCRVRSGVAAGPAQPREAGLGPRSPVHAPRHLQCSCILSESHDLTVVSSLLTQSLPAELHGPPELLHLYLPRTCRLLMHSKGATAACSASLLSQQLLWLACCGRQAKPAYAKNLPSPSTRRPLSLASEHGTL